MNEVPTLTFLEGDTLETSISVVTPLGNVIIDVTMLDSGADIDLIDDQEAIRQQQDICDTNIKLGDANAKREPVYGIIPEFTTIICAGTPWETRRTGPCLVVKGLRRVTQLLIGAAADHHDLRHVDRYVKAMLFYPYFQSRGDAETVMAIPVRCTAPTPEQIQFLREMTAGLCHVHTAFMAISSHNAACTVTEIDMPWAAKGEHADAAAVVARAEYSQPATATTAEPATAAQLEEKLGKEVTPTANQRVVGTAEGGQGNMVADPLAQVVQECMESVHGCDQGQSATTAGAV